MDADSNKLSVYTFDSSNSLTTLYFNHTFLIGRFILYLAINADATLFACINDDQNLYVSTNASAPT